MVINRSWCDLGFVLHILQQLAPIDVLPSADTCCRCDPDMELPRHCVFHKPLKFNPLFEAGLPGHSPSKRRSTSIFFVVVRSINSPTSFLKLSKQKEGPEKRAFLRTSCAYQKKFSKFCEERGISEKELLNDAERIREDMYREWSKQ